MRVWRTGVIGLVLLLVACGTTDETPRTETSAGQRDTAPGAPRPEYTGEWSVDAVEDRLDRAGLAPHRAGPVARPFLTVPGVLFHVGGAELQVYVYPDSVSRSREIGRLDSVTVSPPDAEEQWAQTPHLITSNNLAAILLSRDAQLRERVANALQAGLPARQQR